ncbi:threonine-phosphate decarboxylase [Paramagnetospirillum kuznetsovii]|uniref:threonine-phosphate decarboxylase n=1 Tax=Paramagnetospirillum kuznetsovii TaxID=2053833 RepID=A0A364NSV6_9PROT|nr:threonine-phosphate decarboxylase CobD [Paramagnetospirillum kuznetsovii]RAU20169.1 threonine-phosphate decarboxylase [Paramagnetospirillum kuznetsovii]
MAVTSLPLHGGDLAAAEALWGRPAEGWLDLSTGINPWPYPLPAMDPSVWHRLPGAAAEAALLAAARRCWDVPETAGIVAAPGSQPLIQAVPRLRAPGRVAVVGPTYGEHARAWAAAGHGVSEVADLTDAGDAAAVVVVNPNNPDGRVTPTETLLQTASTLVAGGGLLVVDEAFGECDPSLSVASRPCPGLVVLRSFGKFYGLAGLRLGFAVAQPDLAERLGAMMGPWAVSGPALAVGATALSDAAWAVATRKRLAEAAARLAAVLTAAGFEIVGGTSLFQLARHSRAAEIYQHLGRAGILTRAFAERPRLLRFGLPDDQSGLDRLERALAAIPAGCRGPD